jgi:PAS domain-containing protein
MDQEDSATARSRKRNGGTRPPASAAAAEERRGRGAAEAAPSERARLYTTLEAMPDADAMMSAVRGDAGQIIDFRYDFANVALGSAIGLTHDELSSRRLLLELFAGHRHWGLFDVSCRVVATSERLCHEDLACHGIDDGREIEVVLDVQAVKLGDGYYAKGDAIGPPEPVSGRVYRRRVNQPSAAALIQIL